jgi:lysophospholipase L1-like esterase
MATLAVVALLLAWELRARYEHELSRRIWPDSGQTADVSASAGDPDERTVLLLGDSRVAQWETWVPRRGRIVRAGFSGAPTAEVRARTKDLLAKYTPEVVVIEAGINDLKLLGLRPDLRREVVDTVVTNLFAIAKECAGARAQVLLLTVWPATRPDLLRRVIWDAAVDEATAEVNRRLISLGSREHGVIVCDLLSDAGPIKYRDTVHLDSETYSRINRVLEKRLNELTVDAETPSSLRR